MTTSRGETILVIDDEEIVLSLLQRSFERMGYRVIAASNGAEAVEAFREHAGEIAGVVLDLTMPKMSGEQVFDALREIDPMVRVILTSGFSEQESISRFGDRSVVGFIQKPFRPLKIIEKAKSLFNLRDGS